MINRISEKECKFWTVTELVRGLYEDLGQVRLIKPWSHCSERSVRCDWAGEDVSWAWLGSGELWSLGRWLPSRSYSPSHVPMKTTEYFSLKAWLACWNLTFDPCQRSVIGNNCLKSERLSCCHLDCHIAFISPANNSSSST